MRLYVNRKEIPILKAVLAQAVTPKMIASDKETAWRITQLLNRVELCERLQESEKSAVRDEINEFNFAEVVSDESN